MPRIIDPESLTLSAFQSFGSCHNLLAPQGPAIVGEAFTFYRDILPQRLDGEEVLYSICRVVPREPVIDVLEHHDRTAELMMPLDNDMLLQVAPATPKADGIPLEKIRVFRVPCGTAVVLDAGVWHHGPFALNGRPCNILVALPRRTYANDATVVTLNEADRPRIQL